MQTFDLAVVGDGIFGCASAYFARAAGMSVAIVSRQAQPLHEMCSSRGESRTWRPPYEAPHYDSLIRPAERLWSDLNVAFEDELIGLRTGGLEFGDADCEGFLSLPGQMNEHDEGFEKMTAASLATRFPNLGMLGTAEHCLFRDNVRVIYASRARKRLYEAAEAERFGGYELEGLDSESGGVKLKLKKASARDTIFSKHVVLAAGGGLTQMLEPLGFNVPSKLTLEQYSMIQTDASIGPFPPSTYQSVAASAGYYIVPSLGQGIKIGERIGGPDVRRLEPTNEIDSDAEARCKTIFTQLLPGQSATSVQSIRCTYEWSMQDYRPIIGLLPGFDRVAVCGLFTGGGFKFAPLVAREILRMLSTGSSGIDLSAYSPSRFAA